MCEVGNREEIFFSRSRFAALGIVAPHLLSVFSGTRARVGKMKSPDAFLITNQRADTGSRSRNGRNPVCAHRNAAARARRGSG